MSLNDGDNTLSDRLFYGITLLVLGAVFGALIGLFSGLFAGERSLHEILYPWAYVLGVLLGAIGFLLPRFGSVLLLILSGCQIS